MPLHLIYAPNLSLEHTLRSGQSFCWSREGDLWTGWIGGSPCRLRMDKENLVVDSPSLSVAKVRDYFQLNPQWDKMLSAFPEDEWVTQSLVSAKGLRCVREEWWECVGNFICSALKQISQNVQINHAMRKRFGDASDIPGMFSYPSPERVASLGEKDLRACGLGFRARHLHKAARQIVNGEFDWDKLAGMETEQASLELQKLAGVGHKVAHCILLHGAGRWDAFPIDVWVERLIGDLYFPRKRIKPSKSELEKFSRKQFGEYRGVVQLYLFHWYRTQYAPSKPRGDAHDCSGKDAAKDRARKGDRRRRNAKD